MPTYAYECQACGTKFDQYQKFTDAPISKCPNCKKNKVRRVVGASAIVFKGSGWYKTDNRSKSPTTAKGNGTEKAVEKTAESPAAEKPADTSSGNSDGNGNSDGAGKAAKTKKEAAAAKSDE